MSVKCFKYTDEETLQNHTSLLTQFTAGRGSIDAESVWIVKKLLRHITPIDLVSN